MPLFLSCFLRVTLLVRSPLLLSPLEVNGWSPPLSPPVFAREPITPDSREFFFVDKILDLLFVPSQIDLSSGFPVRARKGK